MAKNCNFISPHGTKCTKKRICDSEYCYLKSHYPTVYLYKVTMSNISDSFSQLSSSRDRFTVYDVDKDGACMYYCLSRFLFNFSMILKNHKLMGEYFDILKINKGITENIMEDPKKLNDFIKSLTDADFDESRDCLSRYLQQKIKNWCVANASSNIDEFGISLSDWILMTHEEIKSIEDYNNIYDIFAGDPDFILTPSDEKYKSGKNKGQYKMIKEEIPERWGGITELYAFNNLFNTSVNVYIFKKFDQRKGEIVTCTSRSANARYSMYTILDTIPESNICVNLMLDESRSSHYMLLL